MLASGECNKNAYKININAPNKPCYCKSANKGVEGANSYTGNIFKQNLSNQALVQSSMFAFPPVLPFSPFDNGHSNFMTNMFTMFAFMMNFNKAHQSNTNAFSPNFCGNAGGFKGFCEALGYRESGGRYDAKNRCGYLGKYQMGEAALIDAGYYKKSSKNYNNDWSGKFTGKDGVYSMKDFLNNKQAQENANKVYKQVQWNQLKKNGAAAYVGKVINGHKLTESGLLAGAHLVGSGSVAKYVKSAGKYIPRDGNRVPVEQYIRKFAGHDVSSITGAFSRI